MPLPLQTPLLRAGYELSSAHIPAPARWICIPGCPAKLGSLSGLLCFPNNRAAESDGEAGIVKRAAVLRVQAVLSGAVAMTFLLNIDDTIFKSMQVLSAGQWRACSL